MLCYVMLCYVVMLLCCYVMLCYVMLSYVMLCYVLCYVMLCFAIMVAIKLVDDFVKRKILSKSESYSYCLFTMRTNVKISLQGERHTGKVYEYNMSLQKNWWQLLHL